MDHIAGGRQGRAGEDRVSLFKNKLKKSLKSKCLAGVQQSLLVLNLLPVLNVWTELPCLPTNGAAPA